MNYKEITELLKLISDSHLSEFKMKDGDFQLSVKTDRYHKKSKETGQAIQIPAPQDIAPTVQSTQPVASAPAPTDAAPASPTAPTATDETKGYLEIKSPMVGTFYRSSSPDKPPFVKIGDQVEKGAVVCIVEAMKLFNEIESEIGGKIVKVLVEDAAPIEYDQPLFLIDPS